jgi:uncharacterized damage-inducible protein DinB
MPTPLYAQTMARYNLWQNNNLVGAASGLSGAERQRDRGAFFGSIQKTFSHLYWADQIWLSRFAGTPAPAGGISASLGLISDWNTFVEQRAALDHQILEWATTVYESWFDANLTWYSGALGRDVERPKQMLVTHFFNHQTHHRGQIHAMLTAAGIQPGDTDLFIMPSAEWAQMD